MRITPSVDPPQYTANPWWPLTIMETVSADKSWTPVDVHASILDTLALKGATVPGQGTENKVPLEFKFRVLTVRMWGIDKQPIQLAVCDASDMDSSSWTHEFNDFASGIQFSRVGWKFGDVFSHRVMTTAQSKMVLFALGQGPKPGKVLVYIQVLIRLPNAPDPVLLNALSRSMQSVEIGYDMV